MLGNNTLITYIITQKLLIASLLWLKVMNKEKLREEKLSLSRHCLAKFTRE